MHIRISLRISRFILFTCCSSEAIKGAVLFIFLPKFLRFVSAAYRNALHCIVYREGGLLNIATFFSYSVADRVCLHNEADEVSNAIY